MNSQQNAVQKPVQKAGSPQPGLLSQEQRQNGRAQWPLLVSLLLAALLVVRIGLAAREWLAGDAAGAVPPAEAAGPSAQAHTDLAAVQALNLFGAGQSGTAAPAAAPPGQTNLSLQLQGVMLATPAASSVAIIVSGGQQQSYRAGDPLPGGDAITVESIHGDHVVIDNKGRPETLWLYQGRSATAPATGPQAAATALANLSSSDPAVRQAAAVTLAEVIQITPAVENGALIGYRLMPGVRLKEFVQSGFQTNDIVTAVNGIPLNDMANASQLYSLMNEATEVSFSLLREGQTLTLQFPPGNQ